MELPDPSSSGKDIYTGWSTHLLFWQRLQILHLQSEQRSAGCNQRSKRFRGVGEAKKDRGTRYSMFSLRFWRRQKDRERLRNKTYYMAHQSWLTGWLADWLTGWLADWLTGWLTDWLTDSLTASLTDWLTDCLTMWLADWQTDGFTYWLHNRLTEWQTDTTTNRWDVLQCHKTSGSTSPKSVKASLPQ